MELVGDDSPDADAEVIALAVASLQAAGVKSFKIAVGHVGFLNGLLEDVVPGREDIQEALKDGLLHRDYVGYRETLAELSLSPQQRDELEEFSACAVGRKSAAKRWS